jgi:hypothetical protein
MRSFEPSALRTQPPQTEDQAAPGRNPTNLDARLRMAEQRLRLVIAALNAASINAACNEDGTITVTLTIPNLPSV